MLIHMILIMKEVMKCQYSGSSLHSTFQYGQYIILSSVVCNTILS